ncbi:MAG: hypothetical protein GX575_22105 [Candidatus Anammoximicrobium sp.]|nr:hypothetical protein [Candidatus Anammoximicrobium sp.]
MSRAFRVWGKKRGNRRTGSQLLGTVGEVAFSSALFMLGVVSLTALVLSQTLSVSPPFPPGFGFWVLVLVLSSFVLLGGGGVVWSILHASATREWRSALARRAANLDLRGTADEGDAPRAVFPNIPSDANLTNSPGIKLSYRLPVVQSPAWRLILASVFGLIWNISAVVLIFFAVKSIVNGRPEWFLVLFIIPFLAVGAWLVQDVVRQMLIHTGIGPTQVEISDHPLHPCQSYEVYLSQGGRLWMRLLTLSLVCEEAATYQQGTDLRTETKTVFDRQIFRKTDFRIDPGMPFEHQCAVEIPADAAHSFQSEHNAVNWKLVVRGEADAWPPFERAFPVIVHPAHDGFQAPGRTSDRAADL